MFQDGLLEGKRILITGGGTGLGRAIAEQYLSLGAEIHICGRRGALAEEAAESMMASHGGKVVAHALDIRNAEAVDEVVERIFTDHGALTGLVNNAAGNFVSRTEDLSHRGFDAIAEIVMHGTFYVTHSVGRRWISAGLPGSVVSIIVTWVFNGGPFVVPSAMSKSAVHTMTKSLATEWGRYGIRLNAIAPGEFPTEGMSARLSPGMKSDRSEDNPMGRVGRMPELQNLATFMMSDEVGWLNGQSIAIDGGQWMASGGNFYRYREKTDEDWQNMRELIKARNDQDRKQRTA